MLFTLSLELVAGYIAILLGTPSWNLGVTTVRNEKGRYVRTYQDCGRTCVLISLSFALICLAIVLALSVLIKIKGGFVNAFQDHCIGAGFLLTISILGVIGAAYIIIDNARGCNGRFEHYIESSIAQAEEWDREEKARKEKLFTIYGQPSTIISINSDSPDTADMESLVMFCPKTEYFIIQGRPINSADIICCTLDDPMFDAQHSSETDDFSNCAYILTRDSKSPMLIIEAESDDGKIANDICSMINAHISNHVA